MNENERMKELAGLYEVSLSRAYNHFQNKEIPVAIITAFRTKQDPNEDDAKTKAANIAANKKLASDIRSAGYGFTFIDGVWRYEDGTESSEDSILVIGDKDDNGKLKGLLKKWITTYKQEAAILKDSGSGDVTLVWGNGKTEKLGKFSTSVVQGAYTRLRGRGGRTFKFEHAYLEKNWISKLIDERGF